MPYKGTREERNAAERAYRALHKESKAIAGKKYRTANSATISAKRAEAYANDPTKTKARSTAWYVANKEKANARSRAYYAANRERHLERGKAWLGALKISNPEAYQDYRRGYVMKRRARMVGSKTGRIDWVAVRSRNGMICGICLQPIEGAFEYDHILPLSKGGPHITENLQLSHSLCNRKKSSKKSRL